MSTKTDTSTRMRHEQDERFRTWMGGAALAAALLAVLTLAACGGPRPSTLPEIMLPPEDWGIQPVGLFLLDRGERSEFRYKVTDPEAALDLLSRSVKAFLVREESGERHELPLPVRAGNLELLELDPDPRRVYFMRFTHPVFSIDRGERVSLVIGSMRAQGLEARGFNDIPPGTRTGLPPAEPEIVITMPHEDPIIPPFEREIGDD